MEGYSLVIIIGCFEMKTAQAQTIVQNQMQEATKMVPNINVISGTGGNDILVESTCCISRVKFP